MAEQTLLESGRRINFLKKLQSICGVLPLGVFFCFHMVANYTFTWSVPAYDAFSHFLETMPYKDLLEITVIFAPLLCTLLSASISLRREAATWAPIAICATGAIFSSALPA